jgi:hypothetical protein
MINNLFVTSGQGGERTRITGSSIRMHLPHSYWVTVLFVTVTQREEDRKLMMQSGCYLRWLINDRNIKFLASASPYAGGWQEASTVGPTDVNNQFPSQQRYLENPLHLSLWLFIWLFNCNLFNDAVSNSDHAGLNEWMRVNNGIESTWGESGRCLLWGTNPALLWKDQAKPRKNAVSIVSIANFESGSPSLGNVTWQCACTSAPKVDKIQQKLTTMTAKSPYCNCLYGTQSCWQSQGLLSYSRNSLHFTAPERS